MKIHQCEPKYHWELEQNTPEWLAARCGLITASSAGKFITPTLSRSDSKTAESYCFQVCGEIVTGKPKIFPTTPAMRWGHEHETTAREVYEHLTGNVVRECGFITAADPAFGASPDGLIGDDGGIEIKCPQHVENHLRVAYDRQIPNDSTRAYWVQVLDTLWVSGRQWWDYVSYHPWVPEVELALIVIHVERDAVQMQQIEDAALSMRDQVNDTISRLRGEA